jgi:hypothetical protein
MIATTGRREAAWALTAVRAAPARPREQRWRRGRFLTLLLAGYVLFCHGCHGDEDTELLARRVMPGPAVRLTAAALPSAAAG